MRRTCKDFAHKTSRTLADSDALLFVLEELRIKNMTRSAKGTVTAPGANIRAKTGLNRGILASAWSNTALFFDYKAQRKGKLLIKVPPHYSSQECSHCGHTHPDNRTSQARLVCMSCGYEDNADVNAARVLARRGVRALLAGDVVVDKPKKRCAIRRPSSSNKVGQEVAEPVVQTLLTPVETAVSRSGASTAAHWSPKQETSTTTPLGIQW